LKRAGLLGDPGTDGDQVVDEGDRFRRIIRRDEIADRFQVLDRLWAQPIAAQ
jgi:hypothetical protein